MYYSILYFILTLIHVIQMQCICFCLYQRVLWHLLKLRGWPFMFVNVKAQVLHVFENFSKLNMCNPRRTCCWIDQCTIYIFARVPVYINVLFACTNVQTCFVSDFIVFVKFVVHKIKLSHLTCMGTHLSLLLIENQKMY